MEGYSTLITNTSSFITMLHIWFSFHFQWHKSGIMSVKSVELNWCKWGYSGFSSIQTSLLWHVNCLPFYNRSHLGVNFQCAVWSLDWYVIHVCHFENASAPLKGYEGKMVTSIMLLKRLLFIKTSLCHEDSARAYCRKSRLVFVTDLWNNSWIMETYFVHIRGIYNPPPTSWKN